MSLSSRRYAWIAPWILCFTGFWLNFAPLLFWAKVSVEYLNDTVVGVLLVAFSIIVPGLPRKVEEKGHEIPKGWSYNPSAWIQRLPVIILACVGWFISRYLAAYQLGFIDSVWDPVFGTGTKDVITSSVAHFFPVADAGLGAFAYTIEALMGCKGGANRWRTMPWLVVGFVLLVVPLGVVSIILVVLQPLLVGAWCFLCLVTALSMMIMILFTIDELVAVFQFLYRAKKEGQPFWKVFWHGGDLKGTKNDNRTPSFSSNPWGLIKTLHFGIGFRWNLFISTLLGAWLMLTPYAFSFSGVGADSDHLIGALVVVVSVISLAEVARGLRWVNVILGLWVAIASWFLLPSGMLGASFNHLAIGVLLILIAIPRGKILETYG